MVQPTVALNGRCSKPGGELLSVQRLIKCSLSGVQIKDSGLIKGADDGTSPFLAVNVSFRVHSKEIIFKRNALI